MIVIFIVTISTIIVISSFILGKKNLFTMLKLKCITNLLKTNTKKDSSKTRNPGHNILVLYNSLVEIQFNTSKTKLDILYSKLGIRVASRVPERLKT